jgi:hemerythrin-like metal-binding protein
MVFFQWKDSFNIGSPEIDRQHRSFLEMLNEYYDSTSGGTKDNIGRELIQKLKNYAAMHFRYEEDLMQSMGYKDVEKQREQHRYFESLVSDLESAPSSGRTEALKSSLSFLRDWFLSHILEEDRKFIPHIKPTN